MTNYQKALIKLRGFSDGAGSRAMQTPEDTWPADIYEAGYIEGQKSRREASDKFATEFGTSFREVVIQNLRIEHCPFCGSGEVILTNDDLGSQYAACQNCHACGPSAGELNDALKYWNERKPNDPT